MTAPPTGAAVVLPGLGDKVFHPAVRNKPDQGHHGEHREPGKRLDGGGEKARTSWPAGDTYGARRVARILGGVVPGSEVVGACQRR